MAQARRLGGTPTPVYIVNGDIGVSDAPFYTTSPNKSPRDFIFKYMENVSGPSGSTDFDMNVDASSADSVFEYTAPAGKTFKLYRVNIILVDGSIRYGQFGGLGGALTDGIIIRLIGTDDGTLIDFTGDLTIKTNEDFGSLAGADNIVFSAAGDDSFPVRWTLARAGAPVYMTAGQKFRVILQDDLSNLTKFRMMVQGILSDA